MPPKTNDQLSKAKVKNKTKRNLSLILVFLLLVLGGETLVNVINPYAIRDWWILLNYKPPIAVVSLA